MHFEKDILLRLIEYGLNNSNGFSYPDLLANINPDLNETEKLLVERYCKHAHENRKMYSSGGYPTLETIFLLTNSILPGGWEDKKCNYVINLDAKFRYIDYTELKEARASSRMARSLALIAIGLSVIAIGVSILIPFLITQTVKLESDQLKIIIDEDNKR